MFINTRWGKNNRPKKKKKITKRDKKKYYEYLQSPEWKIFRQLALDTLGHSCGKCGNKKDLQVHHKHYRNIFKENISDVMILCKPCHKKTHRDKALKNPKPLTFMRHANYDTSTTTFYPDRKINPKSL